MADVSAPITGANYTDDNIKALQAQLNKASESLKAYNTNAATDEELRGRAESEYNPSYNQQVQQQEAAKQTAATARDETLSAIERQYKRDAETLGRSYDQQRVTANNTMLARGLNNSSLAAAMLNLVETERNRALQNLQAERTASETSAQNTYNNAIKAADAAIGQLNADRETAIDARYQALKDAEQQRVMQATAAQNDLTQYTNNLLLQIEQLRQQGYSQYLQQQAAEAERQLAAQQAEEEKRRYEEQMAFNREQWENEKTTAAEQAAEAKRQYDEQMALKREQWEYEKEQTEKAQKKSSSSSSSSYSGSGSKTTTSSTAAPTGSLENKYNTLGSAVSAVGNALKTGASNLASTLSGLLAKTKK